MSLTVTRAKVKEKAGIDVTDYDSPIDNLIADWVPALEFAIRPEILADSTTGLVASLNLGATEVVAGEILAQIGRKPGMYDRVTIGDLSWQPFAGIDPLDPSGLKAQGLARLAPYLRDDPGIAGSRGVSAVGGKIEEDEP